MDESCSSGAVAPRYVAGEMRRFSGKEIYPRFAAWTNKFTNKQYEAAKLLEVTYHSISNFPELAKMVRSSALEARTLHQFAATLMKKYAMTASQIVDKAFPLILESVDDGDTDVVKRYFDMIIEWAEDMKKETEDTRDRYIKLTKKLQAEDIVEVKKKQVEHNNEKRDIEVQKEHAEKAKEAEDAALAELVQQEEQHRIELNELMKIQNTITGELHEGSNSGKAYAFVALLPVIGWGAAYFGLKANKANFKKKLQMKSVLDKDLEKAEIQQESLMHRKHGAQKAALERFQLIQQLDIRNELLGDESRLLEAILRLGDAGKLLNNLSQFWDDMAILLNYLGTETEAGKPQLENIEKPKCAARFKRILGDASEKWSRFGEICTCYVNVCETDRTQSIEALYGFLDGRADLMTDAQRKREMQKIKEEFKHWVAIEDIQKQTVIPIDDQ